MKYLILHVLYFALLNMAVVLLGYVFVKRKMIWQSWFNLVVVISTIHFMFLQVSPIVRMLALIATAFTAMKVMAAAVSYQHTLCRLTFKQWLFFAVGWAGMRAQPFETLGGKALPGAWPMIRFGISRVMAGGFLLLLAHLIVQMQLNQQVSYILVSMLLLVSFSLILHFGILSISAGMWRLQGVNTYYLFKQPVKAKSLGEFWSKRWNLAFSEMTSITIFRPLRKRAGNTIALLVAFLFSGLLHELALSVPVHNGYGLPLLYFLIQGIMVLAEKMLMKYENSFFQYLIRSRLWIYFWIIIPAPLLFHTQFIKQVVWPLAGLAV